MTFTDTSDGTSSEPECPQITSLDAFEEVKTASEKTDPSNNEDEDQPLTKKAKLDKKVHKCTEPGCEAIFARPYRLKNHITSQHKGEKLFNCTFHNCNKSYSSQFHLRRHTVISHTDHEDKSSEVICGYDNCGLVLSNKYSLKKHITRKHINPRFQCRDCQESFSRKSQLNAHKIDVHGESPTYKCDKCPQGFVQLHSYNKHMSRHRTYKCQCENSFQKWTEYLKHKRTDCTTTQAVHKCIVCDKIFTSKQNLTQHSLKVHVADSQSDEFKCPYLKCTRSFKYKKNLTWHIKTYHLSIFENLKCTDVNCEKVFKSRKNLKQHVIQFHSGKPLKVKTPRKPRKDKGIPKKSIASEVSGWKVSYDENKQNINKNVLNENMFEDVNVDIGESDQCTSRNMHEVISEKSINANVGNSESGNSQ